MNNCWKIVWREIGWKVSDSLDNNFNTIIGKNTIREGWAIENDRNEYNNNPTYVWIEDDNLVVNDPELYYPSGCYNIPIILIEQLKTKGK